MFKVFLLQSLAWFMTDYHLVKRERKEKSE